MSHIASEILKHHTAWKEGRTEPEGPGHVFIRDHRDQTGAAKKIKGLYEMEFLERTRD